MTNIKLENLKTTGITKIDNKLFIELPDEVVKKLHINEFDKLIFTIEQKKLLVWKPTDPDIPAAINEELSALFKGDE
jgi:bifunctional DNA-binding transcriptional regulator/antitoxin component of YhaV-PrlF toxin-antitoxin module